MGVGGGGPRGERELGEGERRRPAAGSATATGSWPASWGWSGRGGEGGRRTGMERRWDRGEARWSLGWGGEDAGDEEQGRRGRRPARGKRSKGGGAERRAAARRRWGARSAAWPERRGSRPSRRLRERSTGGEARRRASRGEGEGAAASGGRPASGLGRAGGGGVKEIARGGAVEVMGRSSSGVKQGRERSRPRWRGPAG